jgi:hypothetical protein
VNEARVTLVRPGLPVTIRVDALKEEILEGVVTKVNQYAEPSSYSSGSIKRYGTFVKILNPPPELRVGMNAEVRIHVERKSNALQVPVQALAEVKNHFFALLKNGDQYKMVEVDIGSTNDKVATIDSGLKEGDQVVMNPRSAGKLFELPNLPDPQPKDFKDVERNASAPVTTLATAPGPGAGKGGGPGGPGGGKGGKGAPLDPLAMKARYLENDADKDGKLSKDELAKMDDRRRQALESADKDGDGFLDDRELTIAAGQAIVRMRERMNSGEGGGGPGGGGGRGRRGGEGGPPGIPAGGEQ